MKRMIAPVLCLALVFALSGCGAANVTTPEDTSPTVQVGGQTVTVDESLAPSEFTEGDFTTDAATGRVTCLARDALTGIDVSSHQGEVDWAAVAGDGISFAILRLGNRGYTAGGLNLDTAFEANYAGATENGLLVGAYFFSQAISVEEAEEEADFVIAALNGRALSLPVVFDWEQIVEETARTDQVDTATVTACAAAFCQRLEEAGYASAFYFNAVLGYLQYDIAQLQHLDAWYAEYADTPGFAYAFDLWQYSKTGSVAGIGGNVDLNLYFPPQAPEDS